MKRPVLVGVALLVLGGGGAGVVSANSLHRAYWRAANAEAITTIRSLPVNVLDCRGLGTPRTTGGMRKHRHFRCTAGTRAPWQDYDSIAVLYTVHPRGPWLGARRSRYTLTDVRFVGGPGIP